MTGQVKRPGWAIDGKYDSCINHELVTVTTLHGEQSHWEPEYNMKTGAGLILTQPIKYCTTWTVDLHELHRYSMHICRV